MLHYAETVCCVEHTCCNLFNPRSPHTIPTHVGNDCFIYELPDGSTHPKQKETAADDTPYTILKSAAEIPEQIDGVSGYRLRLYLLKNKAPPTLLVKGIERRLWVFALLIELATYVHYRFIDLSDGYRVTICRPRCTSYESVEKDEEVRL
ncbi:hypothetical protein OESDEN_04626 [Oesophagostomum dentatum]|uniref:Uncharacterized protein n=1 Tax=Oesophagostomum dentatum TaxID=61180 RepID=A0A0B1TJ33_OESDE|nr:hypothetical protein OESDEN_04626 [Oesophagostomum dentatum]